VYGGTTTNISCTIVSNVAVGATSLGFPPGPGSGSGGGIYNDQGQTVSLNSLVAANRASTAGPDVAGLITSQGYNLVGATNGSRGWMAADLTGNTNAPLNPMLGPLRDNGGPTFTMAPLPGSPAIDQGQSGGLATDQRGRPRRIDKGAASNAIGGDASDIGAYEVQLEEFSLARVIRNGSDVTISFETEVGLNYRIERSDVFGSASWSAVAGNIAGTGGMVQLIDSGAADLPRRFYRGQTQP